MKCSFDGCEKTPIASYVWAWGEHGLCCAEHQVILGQQSKQLRQAVMISPLRPGEPTPITREERIQAHATNLALAEELEECRKRGMDLYRENESLLNQLRASEARKAAIEAELKANLTRLDELLEELGKAKQQAARENDELQRLRAIVGATSATQPAPVDPHPEG